MMKLNDWLCSSKNSISYALIKINKKSLLDKKVFNYTTRTQIIDILNDLRSLILPGIYESAGYNHLMLDAAIESKLKHTAIDLCEIIRSVFYNKCQEEKKDKKSCKKLAEQTTIKILEGLPEIRRILDTDINAAYQGDPAAKSLDEIMLSYPSLEAISIYRIAHLISILGVPIVPRIMTEHAHKITGIDIHPNATIGESFFIDHGTGVVIGETCTIGNGVKLYQGVTLGAKSFALDENGNPIKGVKRHPDIRDNVVIYSGATILGGETVIGSNSVIGGNVWLTRSVEPYSTVFNTQPKPIIKNNNMG